MKKIISLFAISVVLIGLLFSTQSLHATSIKFVTEYRYPTSYEVTPIMGVDRLGRQTIIGAIVTPRDFETREVGVVMTVEVEVGELAGVAGMFQGGNIINGNTVLMVSATSGNLSATRQLIRQGVSVNARNKFGSTALFGASAGGFDDIVKTLIEAKAEINAKNRDGYTPLMFAVKNGHLNTTKILLNKGADVNAADNEGKTALMYAVKYGYVDVAHFLIERGARVDVSDRSGETPLAIAQKSDNPNMVLLLTKIDKTK